MERQECGPEAQGSDRTDGLPVVHRPALEQVLPDAEEQRRAQATIQAVGEELQLAAAVPCRVDAVAPSPEDAAASSRAVAEDREDDGEVESP